jgi:hypothetical protein
VQKIQREVIISRLLFGLIQFALAIILAACITAQAPAQIPPVESHTVIRIQTVTPFFPTSGFLPTPTSMIDRLAAPAQPANPTQLQRGAYLFWLNCITCHGDRGQGLSDEWRTVFVEDANCWARGCHAGRNGDQGFPIPHMVPAIISSAGDLPPFKTPELLFEYLRSTHPPQNPGFMPDSDYWALTAYLLVENHRPSAETRDPFPGLSGDRISCAPFGTALSDVTTWRAACCMLALRENVSPGVRAWISTDSDPEPK